MPGQAIITIKDKQWSVAVANTLAEITTGLSGVESMPSQTGVLFDLGYDQKSIQIDMSRMLFPLDIIFINSTQGVVGVMDNIEPGIDVFFEHETLPGARLFLEVNAGEADGIQVGDNVAIQGYVQPAQFDLLPILSIGFMVVIDAVMFKYIVGRKLETPIEHSSEHHSPWLTPEQRGKLEKKYGAVAVRWAEEATRPGDIKGVEAAAEYYHGKLEEVLGLGHLSPELSEEQIRKLRELLGLPVDVAEVLKIHRETGYIP